MTIAKAASATFRAKAPKFMDALMTEGFGFSVEDAAAIFGNAGHESGGLRKLQEIKPTVAGSRGGYGWFQWTGPRRKAFEKWASKNQLAPSDDRANFGFLIYELLTTEKKAVSAVKAAEGLEAKVKAFEAAFERAGVKHYPARLEWAQLALDSWHARPAPAVAAAPTVSPVPIALPERAATVQPEGKAPGLFGWFRSLFATKSTAPVVPVIAGSCGDPTIFYVQKMLRDRAYYTKGFLDGLDGGLTQQAVAQARKDNGMGDGGIDATFLVKLPTFPQRAVSERRANIGLVEATKHAPEVFKPALGGLFGGLSMLGIGGLDALPGLIGQVQGTATQAGEIMSTVQTALGSVAGVVGWLIQHRTLVLVLIGAYLTLRAAGWLLNLIIRVRQAFI